MEFNWCPNLKIIIKNLLIIIIKDGFGLYFHGLVWFKKKAAILVILWKKAIKVALKVWMFKMRNRQNYVFIIYWLYWRNFYRILIEFKLKFKIEFKI